MHIHVHIHHRTVCVDMCVYVCSIWPMYSQPTALFFLSPSPSPSPPLPLPTSLPSSLPPFLPSSSPGRSGGRVSSGCHGLSPSAQRGLQLPLSPPSLLSHRPAASHSGIAHFTCIVHVEYISLSVAPPLMERSYRSIPSRILTAHTE